MIQVFTDYHLKSLFVHHGAERLLDTGNGALAREQQIGVEAGIAQQCQRTFLASAATPTHRDHILYRRRCHTEYYGSTRVR